MATHSSSLAWRVPGTEDPGGLLSVGSHRVRHDRSVLAAAAAGLGMGWKLGWWISLEITDFSLLRVHFFLIFFDYTYLETHLLTVYPAQKHHDLLSTSPDPSRSSDPGYHSNLLPMTVIVPFLLLLLFFFFLIFIYLFDCTRS